MAKQKNAKAKRCKEKWIEGKCQEIEDTNGIVHTGKLFQVAREICRTVNTRLASVKNKEGNLWTTKERLKKDGNNTMKSCTMKGIQLMIRYLKNYQHPKGMNNAGHNGEGSGGSH